ncbi:hypothetical protein BGX33_001387 [Mortierella sp. NVP41]|nr:hypothetical protein BGX33_001387 [Mortierella sp. NVP41]
MSTNHFNLYAAIFPKGFTIVSLPPTSAAPAIHPGFAHATSSSSSSHVPAGSLAGAARRIQQAKKDDIEMEDRTMDMDVDDDDVEYMDVDDDDVEYMDVDDDDVEYMDVDDD